jgi:hypothetical protein
MKRGIFERVFFAKGESGLGPPLYPLQGRVKKLNEFRNKVLGKLPPSTTPDALDDYPLRYKGRKRTKAQNAVDSLKVSPLSRKDSFLSTFLKAEKINFTAKPDPAPRIIQPRMPRYNVSVGRYLKPMEKPLYKAVAKVFGSTTICKGLNAKQRGTLLYKKWNRFRRPVAIGLDASRFDQHVSDQLLRYEHSFYNRHFKCPELKKLLDWQVVNKGFGRTEDGNVKYTVTGCRMSGDMNTALGNCILMCGMIWTYMKDIGVKKYELMNDGDDCVLIVEDRDLSKLDGASDWFKDFGFRMKREPDVRVLEQVEFCQCQPIRDGDSYLMVRIPKIAVSKDLITFKSLKTPRDYDFLRAAISDCGMSLCRGVPVMEAFYEALGRGVERKRWKEQPVETGMQYMAYGMDRANCTITPEVRCSFYFAFGLSPDEQVAIEEYYRGVNMGYREPEFVPRHEGTDYFL